MLPLEGIKILDLSKLAPGPFCTMILGDLGADVLNIEVPSEGSNHPNIMKQNLAEDNKGQEIYNSLNRNKKSIAINLKKREGQQIFYKLAKKADVIVEGFRPGVVKRLGIDYRTISAKNSRIIYCSITGYGQKGPYNKLAGHDINYLSFSGALSLITDKNGKPMVPLNLLGDFAGGGLYAAIGVSVALFVREKTGIGQYIDISMTNGIMSLLTMFFDYYFLNGMLPEPGKAVASGHYPYYSIYQTKDQKYLAIGCTEPWFWKRLCGIIDRADFAPFHFSPKHIYTAENNPKWFEIYEYLKKIFVSRTRDEWFELLTGKDIPVAKVYSLSEVSLDPHVKYQKMIVELKDRTQAKIRQVGIPIKLSKTRAKVRSLGPKFAEHTEGILEKLGYSRNKIEEFVRRGIVQ